MRVIGAHGVRIFEPALTVVFAVLFASPVAKDSPDIVTLRAKRAEEFIDQLRGAFPIGTMFRSLSSSIILSCSQFSH